MPLSAQVRCPRAYIDPAAHAHTLQSVPSQEVPACRPRSAHGGCPPRLCCFPSQ
ncbi:hypothetical protein [Lysobacter gummosus]|uniref:hypothetical protein n=1 Tax=Lysobacter gummosus TaxID=262324 RepID=UPI003630C9BC